MQTSCVVPYDGPEPRDGARKRLALLKSRAEPSRRTAALHRTALCAMHARGTPLSSLLVQSDVCVTQRRLSWSHCRIADSAPADRLLVRALEVACREHVPRRASPPLSNFASGPVPPCPVVPAAQAQPRYGRARQRTEGHRVLHTSGRREVRSQQPPRDEAKLTPHRLQPPLLGREAPL